MAGTSSSFVVGQVGGGSNPVPLRMIGIGHAIRYGLRAAGKPKQASQKTNATYRAAGERLAM